MSEVLILEFDGVGKAEYDEVNDALGIDMESGSGDWPAGLHSHTGAAGEHGFTVVEIWEDQQHQHEFMESRLGAALGKAGLPEPRRAEWMSLAGHHED